VDSSAYVFRRLKAGFNLLGLEAITQQYAFFGIGNAEIAMLNRIDEKF
jgi:hypothetical protein